jgi:protein-S-isoprenylcysteine O-methyltransferase Ste14
MSKHAQNGSGSGENVPRLLARLDVMISLVVVGFLFLIVGEARSPNGENAHETIEWAGLVLIVVSIFGRTWCAIYLGNEKKQALVVQGPYSVCRNPHYGFAVLGAAGVGAQVGSAVVALICGALAWIILQRTTLQEEARLLAQHGEAYTRYCNRTPRFIPKFSLWRDVEMTEVWPQTVATTFLESAVFLLAIPVAEGIEYLHDIQALPVLLRLP